MSIWAEIKHALNSTLGTENFRPLDRILSESKTWSAANAFDKDNRTQNAVYIFSENTATIEGDNKVYFKAKFLVPGSFAIASYGGGTLSKVMYIDVDGTVTTYNQNTASAMGTVSYNKNSIIKIYGDKTQAITSSSRPAIYAISVDTSNVLFL